MQIKTKNNVTLYIRALVQKDHVLIYTRKSVSGSVSRFNILKCYPT